MSLGNGSDTPYQSFIYVQHFALAATVLVLSIFSCYYHDHKRDTDIDYDWMIKVSLLLLRSLHEYKK